MRSFLPVTGFVEHAARTAHSRAPETLRAIHAVMQVSPTVGIRTGGRHVQYAAYLPGKDYLRMAHSRVGDHGQNTGRPDSMAVSRSRSMFPPETTHTILPRPARPESAAATPQAPAPSAMTRARSAITCVAAAISSSDETSEASRSAWARASICGNTDRLPMPSTKDGR